MAEVVLAVYDDVETARRAVNDLVRNGFARGDVGFAVNDPDAKYAHNFYEDEDMDAGEGAGLGAAVGGVTGLVAGLVAITIPGVGPIIAAGPLAAVLGGATGAAIGAAAGAITGGITASLVDMGVSPDHTHLYNEAVRRGGALVTATARGADINRAMEILRRHNPVDIEARAAQWRAEGWQGFDPKADPYTAEQIARERERYHRTTTDDLEYERQLRDEHDSAVRRYPKP